MTTPIKKIPGTIQSDSYKGDGIRFMAVKGNGEMFPINKFGNIPIVTEVTLSELNALVAADGLNEGLQYKVTDKGWLLVATGVNTLKTFNGYIFLDNGDNIPTYIETSYVVIDTGIISTDISLTPFELYIPPYLRVESFDANIGGDGTVTISSIGDFTYDDFEDKPAGRYYRKLSYTITAAVDETSELISNYIVATGVGSGTTIRLMLKLSKSVFMYII